jgi:thiol:disulfide interchange protein
MIRLLLATVVCLSLPLAGIAQEKETIPLDILGGKKSAFSGKTFGGDHALGGSAQVDVSAELVAVDATAVDVKVKVKIPPHYHIYSHKPLPGSIPSKIVIMASGLKLEGTIRSDRPPHVVTEYGATMEQFEDEVTWTQRLRSIDGPLKPGLTISGELTGQVCGDGQCKEIKPAKTFSASLPADFVPPAATSIAPALFAAVDAPDLSSQVVVPEMRLPAGLDQPPIRFTVSLTPKNAAIGDYVTLSIKADIDEPYHTYSITQEDVPGSFPTQIEVEQETGAAATRDTFTASKKPDLKVGAAPGEILELHHGSIEWTREYVVSDSPVAIGGLIRFQVCDEKLCIGPFKVKFAVQTGGGGGGGAPAVAGALADNTDTGEFGGKAAWTGWLPFVISAMGAGFVALLTPCVFPMIPVTVSYFLKQGETSPGSTLKLAIVYCLSIVGAFTGLGLLVSIFLGPEALGTLANSVWLNLVFAFIFTVFALMLLGMFEFQIPSWLLTWTSKKQDTGGLVGVVFMALTFTLVSFTCTFAFVGSVLVLAASGEDYLRPIVGMAAFSAAFASPFFLLALFPSFLKSLPKSGGWMNRVKVTLGLMELAIVTKFLSVADIGLSPDGMPRFLDYHLVMGIWIAIAMVTGMYLLNVFKMPHDTPTDSVGPLSCMFSLAFFGLAAYITIGVFSATPPNGALWAQIEPFAPPRLEVSGLSATHNGLKYALDFDAAVTEASNSNKPMFLDFTGVNCINCRKMENEVLSTDSVHDVLEDLVRVQLFTDVIPGVASQPKVHDRLLARNHILQNDLLKDTALPSYVIATPDGKEILARFIGYNPSGADFERFLQAGLKKWEARQAATVSNAPAGDGVMRTSFVGP